MFAVAPEYRGKGLTTILLNEVISYYKGKDYKHIEAYPATNKKVDSANYHGPLKLFLRHGFTIEQELSEYDDFGDYEEYAIVKRILI